MARLRSGGMARSRFGLGLALSGIRLQLASRFGPGKRIVNESEEDLNEHEKIRALPR